MRKNPFIFRINTIILQMMVFVFCAVSSFAQTNERIKKKEMAKEKEMVRNYNKLDIQTKRKTYSNQTNQKRQSLKSQMGSYSGDKKYMTKGEKEDRHLKNTSGERKTTGFSKPLDNSAKNQTKKDLEGYSGKNKIDQNQLKESNKKVMSNYSGDKKYLTKGSKDDQYLSRTSSQRTFTGNSRVLDNSIRNETKKEMGTFAGNNKILDNQIREQTKKQMGGYSGDQKYMTKAQKEDLYLQRTTAMRQYQGNFKSGNLAHLQKREELKKEMGSYSGDISVNALAKRDALRRKMDKKIGEYQGTFLVQENKRREELKRDMGAYSGDVSMKYVYQREKMRRQKGRKMANYQGSFKNSDIYKFQKNVRKKEKEIANYQGNIKIAKRKKGAHPSSVYRGGQIVNSYKQKEKLRKKMLKKHGRKNDIDMPQHLKDQKSRPKYDAKESEIWW